jgi:hypothetical protein
MTMSINQLMVQDGSPRFYSEAWILMIESHLGYLRARSAENIIRIEPYLSLKHEADLFGLLRHLRIPPEHYITTMRLNDYVSPTDFRAETETLILPDFALVDDLRKVHQTIQKKTI